MRVPIGPYDFLSPCILISVVHDAADEGATDRFLLGPSLAKTAEMSTRRRALALEEPEQLPEPLPRPRWARSSYPQGRAWMKTREEANDESRTREDPRGSRHRLLQEEGPRRVRPS